MLFYSFSYLLDVIEKNLIGTIFHEHLSYHSLSALDKYFRKKELEIIAKYDDQLDVISKYFEQDPLKPKTD